MSDDRSLLQEVDRGQQAADLMAHPLLQEAFTLIRDRYVTEWENSPARDTEAREKIWTWLKQLDSVKSHLSSVMETGKMARMELDRRSFAEKARDGLSGFLR